MALSLVDDAAHSQLFVNHQHTEWFTEWWYFNIRDPKTGLNMLLMYDVSPFGLGIGVVEAMVFRDGTEPVDVKTIAAGPNVSASSTHPDVRVGNNTMKAIDADTYRITASIDGVSWDLTLKRVGNAQPSWLLDNAQGPLDWEVGYWMTFLPLAEASGTVVVNGETYVLEGATAYHDHNWGIWASPIRNWQWLQASSAKEKIALDLGYSDGFDPPRVARLDLDGRTIAFEYGGIDPPTYVGFKDWPGTPWKHPAGASTTLISPDEKTKVEVEWSAPEEQTAPLYETIVLFEQHVTVTLRVYERNAGNETWSAPRTFVIDGFAEWSDSYLSEWSTGEALASGYAAEVIVFGGGVTGLSAAHELTERGFVVTVIEPEEALDPKGERGIAIGGMARSHYARVPRNAGPAPANRPAGRPTPNATHDRWKSPAVAFEAGSAALSEKAKKAITRAARLFRDEFCDRGFSLRIVGSAASVEREPRALAARRAEAVRDALTDDGIASDVILLSEDVSTDRPEASIRLDDYVLPGEHGFRFFPAYYRHVTDTMARIPVYDQDGRQTERRVFGNLNPTADSVMLKSGQAPAPVPASDASPTQLLKSMLSTLNAQEYDPRDYLQMAIRIARYLATCPERRGASLESMSWWNFLCGFSPKTRCYLYRYSNSFSRDSTASGRVLAAFDWRYGDARTNGSTFVQLFTPRTDGRFDGTLNAPTTEAWFVHWRKFLDERGVRFVSGSLERLEKHKVNGKDVVIPYVKRAGKKEAEPWQLRSSTKSHYIVVATDAATAERASKPLPKVGVPAGLVGYTTIYDKQPRDPYKEPGLGPDDRFQTLSGIQYFFDENFAISTHAYSLDAKWSLSTLSMQRAWNRLPFKKRDGYAGILSIDIGDFKVPAGPTQTTAWDSTPEGMGEQIWMQMSNDLRQLVANPGPQRLPRPTWFHIDDNLEFGDRGTLKNVVVKNKTPYLVPILSDWARRPGPEPFDPTIPQNSAPPAVAEEGVWTAPHGGYPIHWNGLAYAGIYLKTFTRMTTMESANESARHAVNAILDHYNAHHGTTVAPESPNVPAHQDSSTVAADQTPIVYLGDYCGIWNIERYEIAAFDSMKSLDQVLFDLGLPHIFDLLGIEILPSILSHLFPYRGDCSPFTQEPPPLIPEPAAWCPPFIGRSVGKIAQKFRRTKR